MTEQIEALDRLIDALNAGNPAPVDAIVDPEMAELTDAVVRIRRLQNAGWPEEDWQRQAVRYLARELSPEPPVHAVRDIAGPASERSNGVAPGEPNELESLRTAPARSRRRYVARQMAQMAAAILALVLVAGMLTLLFENQTEHRGQIGASTPINLPDTLISTSFDQTSTTSTLWAYIPGNTAFQPVLQNGNQPVIAPDGRQIVSYRVTRDGDSVHVVVIALDSQSLGRQWQTDVATFPTSVLTQNSLSSAGASIAVTDDRVYVIPEYWNTYDPITIVVLNRDSGKEVSRWSIPRNGDNAASGVWVYASPDGGTLYLLDLTIDASGAQTTPPVYLRVRTSNGQVENRHELTAPDGEHYFPTGRIAPDGRTLYTVVGAWAPTTDSTLSMQFFDLDTGTLLPSLKLPFQNADGIADHEEAVSPDGRTLYVLSPTTSEVAIVDVESHSIKQVVPVKGLTASGSSLLARIVGALRGLVVQQAAAKFYFSGDMQLSPDGKRLYAVGVQGSGYEAMPTGVIAIDTSTWQVVDRWLPDTQVNFLQLSSDGVTLYVETSDSSGKMELTLLDSRTGVASPVDTDVPGYISSLPQLYLGRYGKLPGTASGVSTPSTPLAQIDVSLDRASIFTGDSVTVDAHFVDPRTGQPVKQGQTSVQFDPPATVTATFFHGQIDSDDVVIQLQQVGYGHYRGSTKLKDPTVWSLRVDATRQNAPGSRATLTNAVAVGSAFPGTDGRRYALRLSTDPAQPVTSKATIVQVAFVDAENNTPLPDSVELTDGPIPVDAAFFLGTGDPGQASEMTSMTLYPAGHGRYQGTLAFDHAGEWSVQIDSRQGNQAVSTIVGSVQVNTP